MGPLAVAPSPATQVARALAVLDRASRRRLLLLAVFLAIGMVPMGLSGGVPALVDYPNHLARMSILARAGTPLASAAYEVAWAPYPNLAMDLLVPPLARIIGAEAATLAFLLASQLLLVSGAIALEIAAKGRVGPAGFVALLALYAHPFAWGFVNFEFGLGLALWALAGAVRLSAGPAPRFAAFHALACGLLFFSHLFALGLYGWALGLIELWRWREAREGFARLAVRAALLAAPVLALGLVAASSGGSVGGEGAAWSLGWKAVWLLPLNGFSWTVSALVSLAVAGAAYGLARSGRLRLAGPGPALAVGFLLLFLLMPHRLLDTEFVDVRVVVAALLILPAYLEIGPLSPGERRALRLGFAAVLAANLACVAATQLSYRDDYAAIRASFRLLPPTARVLVVDGAENADPPARLSDYPLAHAPVLAAHDADAFVATLFAYPGKQPVLPRPELRRLSPGQGGPLPLGLALALARGEPAPASASYAATWPRDFDAVYVLNPPAADLLPGILVPLARGERFTLYAVRRPG